MFIATTVVSVAFGCKPSSGTTSIDQTVENQLGKDFTIKFNESKTLALCTQKRITDHINSIFKYCVVSVSDNKIVHSGSYQQGSVKWIANDKIEVTTTEKFSTEPTKKTVQINPSEQ